MRVLPVVGAPIPGALSSLEVRTADSSRALSTFWVARPALFIFLRHFGCVACSEQVTELAWRLRDIERAGVDTILVGSSEPEQIGEFVDRHALGDKPVTVVVDPSLRTYEGAGLVRSRWATRGPRALADMFRAMGRGHRHDRATGDRIQQGGTLLVDTSGAVRVYHRNRSIGDHLGANELVDAALRVATEAASIHV